MLHPTESAGASRARVLIVEDNYLTAEAVCDAVRDCGYDVAGAVGDVDAGISFLAHNDVDGAVVDINLHGDSSFPLCRELRERGIPFVFLSGYDRESIEPEYSAVPYLPKPAEQSILQSLLGQMIKPRGSRGNAILDRLAERDWVELGLRLERVTIRAGQALDRPGQVDAPVYFPISGLVSIEVGRDGQKQIEVAMVGREGMTGWDAVLGDEGCATSAVVQLTGEAWRIEASSLKSLLNQSPELRRQLLRVTRTLIDEMAQAALLIGHATIEQRLARWLVIAHERSGASILRLTHDRLSTALAVRRAGITTALHVLEGKRLVRSRRGRVEIIDAAGLRRETNEFVVL